MKHAKQVRAENSAATVNNQGKKVHSAETPSSATPVKDQTQKPALFERDSINLLGEVDDILRCGMPDNTRGALYIMRGHLEELIESGRALAGLPLGEAPKETPTVAPGEMPEIWAKPSGTSYKPFGMLEPTEDMYLARLFIIAEVHACDQLKFEDGICRLATLRILMEGNSLFAPEREAIRALEVGLVQLRRLDEALAGTTAAIGRPLTGVEYWLANELRREKLTLIEGTQILFEAVPMLRDAPASKDLADAVERMLLGPDILYAMEQYNDTL
jgi:hypothetical protein